MISDALVEKVAIELERENDDSVGYHNRTKNYQERLRYQACGLLTAILPAIEAAVREEDAKIAEAYPAVWEEPECAAKDIRILTSAEIAAAIRARIGAAR